MPLTGCLDLSGVVSHHLHCGKLRGHIGKLELYGLMLCDGLAESNAFICICFGDFKGMFGKTAGNCGNADTSAVETLHCNLEAHTLGGEERVCGEVHVVKGQLAGARTAHAHFVLVLADNKSLGFLGHDES